MFRLILLTSLAGMASAMPACQDKTIIPEGSWVVYNASDPSDVEPDVCKAITTVGAMAPAECCPEAKRGWAGISFNSIITGNSNGTCTNVPQFNGVPWYARCMADGTISYGERCSEGCGGPDGSGCVTLETISDADTGCYLMNSFPGTHIFVHTDGCNCSENINNNGSTSIGPECMNKTATPKGRWYVWNLTSPPARQEIPAKCADIPWQSAAPAECCDTVGAFLGLEFDTIKTTADNFTCPIIPAFGDASWHGVCKADGTIEYGEGCEAGCAPCSLMGTYSPGCYAAASFPGSKIFMQYDGCDCIVDDRDIGEIGEHKKIITKEYIAVDQREKKVSLPQDARMQYYFITRDAFDTEPAADDTTTFSRKNNPECAVDFGDIDTADGSWGWDDMGYNFIGGKFPDSCCDASISNGYNADTAPEGEPEPIYDANGKQHTCFIRSAGFPGFCEFDDSFQAIDPPWMRLYLGCEDNKLVAAENCVPRDIDFYNQDTLEKNSFTYPMNKTYADQQWSTDTADNCGCSKISRFNNGPGCYLAYAAAYDAGQKYKGGQYTQPEGGFVAGDSRAMVFVHISGTCSA